MMRHLCPGGLGPRWHDWAGVREEGASIQSLTSWFLTDSSKIFSNFQHNFAKSAPKSIPNLPKELLGAPGGYLENRSAAEPAKSPVPQFVFTNLGASGRFWVPRAGFQRRSPNHIFGHHVGKMMNDKRVSQN